MMIILTILAVGKIIELGLRSVLSGSYGLQNAVSYNGRTGTYVYRALIQNGTLA